MLKAGVGYEMQLLCERKFPTFVILQCSIHPVIKIYFLSLIGKISLFFLIYYACLAAFFAAMFAIAFSTMPEIKDGPKYTSILEDKPSKLHLPPNRF